MTEVVTLILSNVCGAAIVLSLRRQTTDRRRRPTAPEAPSTLGRSGTPNEEAHRRLVADLDGRGASELRDPQQTSHSMPRGLGRPVACSADGRVLTDQLVAWHGPDRTPQPASEASGTPRHSASAHSARRPIIEKIQLVFYPSWLSTTFKLHSQIAQASRPRIPTRRSERVSNFDLLAFCAAFGSMLPASFALLFPWGPDARTEANRDHPDWTPDRFSLARTLALAWLLAVLVFMLFGVRNPRYTLPAACLLPPLAGAYLSGLGSWLVPTRNRIARVLTLGRPAVLVLALLIGAFVYVRTIEANRRATSATPVGAHIADALGPFLGTTDRPVTVIADDAIEARPELLLALERSARAAGHDLRVRWIPGFGGELPADLPDGPVLALLRVDPESPEAGIPERSAPWFQPPAGLKDPGPWRFHKYSAGIYLISLDPFAD